MTGADGCPFCAYATGHACPDGGFALASGNALAFTPLNPAAPGHLLVIPTVHVATLAELHLLDLGELMFLVGVATDPARRPGYPGLNIVIQQGEEGGQSIEHLHVHVVPRRSDDGLGYRWHPDGGQQL